MIVHNTAAALEYVNSKLPPQKHRSYDMFLRAAKSGKIAHFKFGNGQATRYDFTQTDLDAYVATLTAPKGERVEAGE